MKSKNLIPMMLLVLCFIPVCAVGPRDVILHYDGEKWSGRSSRTNAPLDDVWGSSATDVYAVAYKGAILHFDGTRWSPMNSPTTNHLHGVWGSSNNDVFAVGEEGIILHCE